MPVATGSPDPAPTATAASAVSPAARPHRPLQQWLRFGHRLLTQMNMPDLVDFMQMTTIHPRTVQTIAEMTTARLRVQRGTILIEEMLNESRITVGRPERLLHKKGTSVGRFN